MLRIDRTSSISVPEQLAEQLRYRIASGVYQVGESLPATRAQAKQLGISFHTVRKAYQLLVAEGLLEAQQGSGFRVSARKPLSNEERLERGATIAQQMLQRLVGLGLEDSDIEYLVQEQLAVLDAAVEAKKIVMAAPYLEMAENCAVHIAEKLEFSPVPAVLSRLDEHRDADFICCRPRDLKELTENFPRVDLLGVSTYLTPETLDRIARLFNYETLGLITYYADTIAPLMADIQDQTRFEGQVFGASLEEGASHLEQFIDQTDIIVYTPQTKRRILPFTRKAKRHYVITYRVNEASLTAIQRLVPTL